MLKYKQKDKTYKKPRGSPTPGTYRGSTKKVQLTIEVSHRGGKTAEMSCSSSELPILAGLYGLIHIATSQELPEICHFTTRSNSLFSISCNEELGIQLPPKYLPGL